MSQFFDDLLVVGTSKLSALHLGKIANFNTGGLPIEQYIDAALLRTDGPEMNINGLPLDYGCYDGGSKPANNPLGWK